MDALDTLDALGTLDTLDLSWKTYQAFLENHGKPIRPYKDKGRYKAPRCFVRLLQIPSNLQWL